MKVTNLLTYSMQLFGHAAVNNSPGAVFCLLPRVRWDDAQPITGQVTEVTCPVIGQAQLELTPSKRQKMGPHGGGP